MNLLDLSATAVPAGFQGDGLPFGVTLFAPAHQDVPLLRLAAKLQRACVQTMGATQAPLPAVATIADAPAPSGQVRVAVCGAHMSGLPLNHQLTSRGGRLVMATRSAPAYKFYALPGGPPFRPGMVRVRRRRRGHRAGGVGVARARVRLVHRGDSGAAGHRERSSWPTARVCPGFVCEAYAAQGAKDITDLAQLAGVSARWSELRTRDGQDRGQDRPRRRLDGPRA